MIFVHTYVKKIAYMHVYNNFVCMCGVYVFNDLCEYVCVCVCVCVCKNVVRMDAAVQ